MQITWTAPQALWLLLVIPAVWIVLRFSRTNFNSKQRLLQAGVRSLLLAVLALALARPVISTGSSRISVVFLVDTSHSIATKSINDAADRIDAIRNELKPDHSSIVVFGADAAVMPTTAELRALAARNPADQAAAVVHREATDLEQALHQARAELRPGFVPRVVLFSDGRETTGDSSEAAVQLAAAGIPVFVETMRERNLNDSWVDRIVLPDRLTVGSLIPVIIEIGSQRTGSGVLEVKAADKVIATKPVTVNPGVTAVPVDVTFKDAGAQKIEATIAVEGDPLVPNNRLAREAVVGPRPRVLYVEGAQDSAQYLQGALTQSGFDVTVRPPAGMPQLAADLDSWDAVILSDIPRTSLSDSAMGALAQWVERDGGGLLVTGGEAVFGEAGDKGGPPGYRHTELERLTPVTFERKDTPEVALVIILDKSWSMAGAVMELCKAAAQAAVDVLADEHTLGVITFNDGLNWDVTPRNVGKNRDAIRKTIAGIEPSGHTLIFPAVEQAYLALKDARAKAKHVVLLSDGRSYPDDYEGLVKKMVEAKMTVSSISVGPAADVELLTNIAKWGKGRSYVVEDAKEVPQIFVKEAKNATNPSFDEKALKMTVKQKGFLENVDLTKAPPLRGRTATVVKDNAIEMLATEDGDPLLAFWPIGLGRTAVFAGDVKDRWATEWLKWKGYAPFFSSVVRAIARQRPAGVGVDVVPGVARGSARPLAITVEARDAHGNYLDRLKPSVSVTDAAGRNASQIARQVAPGRYEARVVADAAQPLTVTVDGGDAIKATRLIIPDNAAEYRFRTPDEAGLAAIAQATGGSVGASADALRRAAQSQAARSALWPAFVLAALALWFVDILIRRIRFFEGQGQEAY